MIGCIVVVVIHSVCDFKAARINLKRSLIREILIYELGHNAVNETENICCAKREGVIDHSIITKWFKKFRSSYMNHDDREKSDRRKTMNSEALHQAIEANPASSAR